ASPCSRRRPRTTSSRVWRRGPTWCCRRNCCASRSSGSAASRRCCRRRPRPCRGDAMDYEEAVRFWFGRVNYEQRSPKPSDLKLDRMRALLDALGNPQDRLRIVHVAGSKGKGSTGAMLETALRRAGYRTGLFTSPHLCRVEERVQVDGVPISRAELAAVL